MILPKIFPICQNKTSVDCALGFPLVYSVIKTFATIAHAQKLPRQNKLSRANQ